MTRRNAWGMLMKNVIFKKISRLSTVAIAVIFSVIFFSDKPLFSATGEGASLQFTAQSTCAIGMTIILHQNSSTGGPVSTINFGTLQIFTGSKGEKTLRSSTSGSTGTGSVVAMIYPSPCGGPYYIDVSSQNGPLTSAGGATIPPGACIVVPVYSCYDQWDPTMCIPLTGTMGTAAPWANAGTVTRIYTSDAVGNYRALEAHFAITDDPKDGATTGVPPDQIRGTYSGTVVFTMTSV